MAELDLASAFARLRESSTRWIVYGFLVGAMAGVVAASFAVLLELASYATFD